MNSIWGYKKYLTLTALAGFVVALDQLTKLYVHTQFLHGESKTVIQGFFNITYVRNYGAAFGILADSPPFFRENFFLLMPPAALLIIIYILRSVDARDRIQIFALSAIFGGALGNYIDRLKFRYVVDFIELQAGEAYSWPAFNFADMAIVSGIFTILVLMLVDWSRGSDEDHQKSSEVSNHSV